MVRQPFCPDATRISRWRKIAKRRRENDVDILLQRIEARCAELVELIAYDEWPVGWLLPYRADFRKLAGRTPSATIQLYLTACADEMKPLGVWLLGKCVNRFMLLSVPDFRWDFSEKVRKQVARTLWRLEAWHLLDEMAAEFPNDEKVQWYAAVRSRRPAQPIGNRLRRFSEHVDHSHAADLVGPSRMSFWSRFDPWEGRPPKSVAQIREILERIHRWVRGG
jgi:hypothetical protein